MDYLKGVLGIMSASASQRAKQASSDSAGEDKGDSDSDYCVEPPKKRSNTGRWVRNTFFVSHPREQEVAVGVECSVEYIRSNYDYYELSYEIQQELKSDSDECSKRRKDCIVWFVYTHFKDNPVREKILRINIQGCASVKA